MAFVSCSRMVVLFEGKLGGANGGGNGGGNNGGTNSANKNPRRNTRNQDNESYCHTHGRTCRYDHTSATCNHPAEGHVATATLGDKKGGSTRYT